MTSSDPVQLTLRLMEVDSTSGREGAVIGVAHAIMNEFGWATTRIPVTPGRDNLLATFGTNPRVTFSTHLDTVPPFIAPQSDGDAIRGRGACDAKGIAAAMICAGERLRARGESVAILLVV